MSYDLRHKDLIKAGWRYDKNQDRYAAPDSPTDGTERWYNQAAAWQQYLADQAQGKQDDRADA